MANTRNKWLSRKFLLAVATAIFVILEEGLGLNLPKEAIMAIVAVVIAWITGESIIDAKNK